MEVRDQDRSSRYNIGMKPLFALFVIFGLAFLAVHPAAAQLATSPQKLTPQKYCSSSDNSLECVSQRNQANIDRYAAEYKEQVRQQKERLEADQRERDRQRAVREKDCNPRVQRCD